MMKMMRYVLVFLLISISFFVSAQYDETHYVPAFYGRTNVDKHYIVLSTLETNPVNITVSDGNGTVISTHVVTRTTPVT